MFKRSLARTAPSAKLSPSHELAELRSRHATLLQAGTEYRAKVEELFASCQSRFEEKDAEIARLHEELQAAQHDADALRSFLGQTTGERSEIQEVAESAAIAATPERPQRPVSTPRTAPTRLVEGPRLRYGADSPAQGELQVWAANLAAWEEALEQMEHRLSERERELMDSASRYSGVSDVQKRRDDLRCKMADLLSSRRGFELQLEAAKTRETSLKTRLAEAEGRCVVLEEKVGGLQECILALKGELRRSRELVVAAEEREHRAEVQYEEARDTITALRTELDTACGELSKAREVAVPEDRPDVPDDGVPKGVGTAAEWEKLEAANRRYAAEIQQLQESLAEAGTAARDAWNRRERGLVDELMEAGRKARALEHEVAEVKEEKQRAESAWSAQREVLEMARREAAEAAAQLSEKVRELEASVETARRRITAAEGNAAKGRQHIITMQHRSAEALGGSAKLAVISSAWRALDGHRFWRRYHRQVAHKAELHAAHAEMRARCLGLEERKAQRELQVQALASEIRAVHREKEALLAQLHLQHEQVLSRSHGVSGRVFVMLRLLSEALHHHCVRSTRAVAFHQWRVWALRSSRSRSLQSQLRQLTAISDLVADECVERVCLREAQVAKYTALLYQMAHRLRRASDRQLVCAVRRVQAVSAKALEAAGRREVLSRALGRLWLQVVVAKGTRLRERDRVAARRALDRASDELAEVDRRQRAEAAAQRAAAMLALEHEAGKALQARVLRRWSIWAVVRRMTSQRDAERVNHRKALERATEELGIAEKRMQARCLQLQGISSVVLQQRGDAVLLARCMQRLLHHSLTRRVTRHHADAKRVARGVGVVAAHLAEHLHRSTRLEVVFQLWKCYTCARSQERKATSQRRDVLRKAASAMAQLHSHRHRAMLLVRWTAHIRSKQPRQHDLGPITFSPKRSSLRSGYSTPRPLRNEDTELAHQVPQPVTVVDAAELAELREQLDEERGERMALQTINDEIRVSRAALEQAHNAVNSRYRAILAHCTELSHSLAALEHTIAKGRGKPADQQWDAVMKFVQGAKGWWKNVSTTAHGTSLSIGGRPGGAHRPSAAHSQSPSRY